MCRQSGVSRATGEDNPIYILSNANHESNREKAVGEKKNKTSVPNIFLKQKKNNVNYICS